MEEGSQVQENGGYVVLCCVERFEETKNQGARKRILGHRKSETLRHSSSDHAGILIDAGKAAIRSSNY